MTLRVHSTQRIQPSFNCCQGRRAGRNEIRTRKNGNYVKTEKGFQKLKNVEKG